MDDDASTFVVTAVFIMIGSTIFRLVKEGKWQHNVIKTVVFGFLLITGLLIVNAVSPTIARVLAGLGIVGAFAVNGPILLSEAASFGAQVNQPAKTTPIRTGATGGGVLV